ncbi:hypothetical protein GUITHDRAFT_110081 [Guillardia theta CCMP2712]|uniref:PH domain-containing protein n=5 Tax=Guillardia theta TaxID=55529 RepID=L1J610_GUITC|nr:hypothetical protein GUITHDRAFT_110081 [Guillardia theta CCMP2712]EKX43973.1 hypothetical protein GUITHDRAFT_110081 [Guillardia theta CCMP2712]|eukprot:XP_005830953.1 hypothetical protein GUITHDRAFT_110081 [Guillardia theta CCMP2712]
MSLWKSDSILAIHAGFVSMAIALDLVASLFSSAKLRPVDTRRTPGCVPHSRVVTVGSRVRVKGLASARQYNGLVGVVRSKYGKRFAVEVWGFPEDLMLKSKNLEVIGCSLLSIESKKSQQTEQGKADLEENITALASNQTVEKGYDDETISVDNQPHQAYQKKVKEGPLQPAESEQLPKASKRKTFENYLEKFTGFKQKTSTRLADSVAPAAHHQGWLYSREPALLALWHKRWCVVRQGQLDLYEDDSMQKLVMTVPLSQCRIEKTRVMDGRLQQGCDFEYGIRVVLGKGILMELGAQERLLAAGQGVLVHSTSERASDKMQSMKDAQGSDGQGMSSQVARFGVQLGKSVETLFSSDPSTWFGGVKDMMQEVQSKASIVFERLKNSSDWISDDDEDDGNGLVRDSVNAQSPSVAQSVASQSVTESYFTNDRMGHQTLQDSLFHEEALNESAAAPSGNFKGHEDHLRTTAASESVLKEIEAIQNELAETAQKKEDAVKNEDYQLASVLKSKIDGLKSKIHQLQQGLAPVISIGKDQIAALGPNDVSQPMQKQHLKPVEPYVKGGWLYSREPALLALWHKRWCVVRQGQLDLYEDDSMQKLVMTVPLSQCRIEKTRVMDGRLQQGCDFEYGIRVVLGKGILMELGAQERLLAAGQGALEVGGRPEASGQGTAGRNETGEGLGGRLAKWGVVIGKHFESLLTADPQDTIKKVKEEAGKHVGGVLGKLDDLISDEDEANEFPHTDATISDHREHSLEAPPSQPSITIDPSIHLRYPPVRQGWLYSREPALLALWHKRWCVVRQGQLDLYEDDSMQKLVMTVPLSQCRIEKTRVMDGRRSTCPRCMLTSMHAVFTQEGNMADGAWGTGAASGGGVRGGAGGVGGGVDVLQAGGSRSRGRPEASGQRAAGRNETGEGLGGRPAKWGVAIGKGVESVLSADPQDTIKKVKEEAGKHVGGVLGKLDDLISDEESEQARPVGYDGSAGDGEISIAAGAMLPPPPPPLPPLDADQMKGVGSASTPIPVAKLPNYGPTYLSPTTSATEKAQSTTTEEQALKKVPFRSVHVLPRESVVEEQIVKYPRMPMYGAEYLSPSNPQSSTMPSQPMTPTLSAYVPPMISSLRPVVEPVMHEEKLSQTSLDIKSATESFTLDWDKCMTDAIGSWGVFAGHEETIIDQEFQYSTRQEYATNEAQAPKENKPLPPPVRQGWLYSREPALLALWHKRWCVVRQGQLDLYEDDSMQKLVMTVPLSQCRIEKTRVMDGRLQQGCDFEYGIRVVLGKGILMELGAQERLLAAGSEEEREGWGAALMSCRQGALEVGGRPEASGQRAAGRNETGEGLGGRLAKWGVAIGKGVESVLSADPQDTIKKVKEEAGKHVGGVLGKLDDLISDEESEQARPVGYDGSAGDGEISIAAGAMLPPPPPPPPFPPLDADQMKGVGSASTPIPVAKLPNYGPTYLSPTTSATEKAQSTTTEEQALKKVPFRSVHVLPRESVVEEQIVKYPRMPMYGAEYLSPSNPQSSTMPSQPMTPTLSAYVPPMVESLTQQQTKVKEPYTFPLTLNRTLVYTNQILEYGKALWKYEIEMNAGKTQDNMIPAPSPPPPVRQGWLYSREPALLALWHKRWCVVRQGQLDLYEDDSMQKLVMTVPLSQCRIEKTRVMDGRLQQGCDFEYGIRVGALEVGGRPEASGQRAAGRNETGEGLRGRLAKWGVAIGKGVESVLSADPQDTIKKVKEEAGKHVGGVLGKLDDLISDEDEVAAYDSATLGSAGEMILGVGDLMLPPASVSGGSFVFKPSVLDAVRETGTPAQTSLTLTTPDTRHDEGYLQPKKSHVPEWKEPQPATSTADPNMQLHLTIASNAQTNPPVRQGWLYSREPALLALWHKRWCVVRQGQLDLYEDDSMQKLVMTVPLSQCRIEKTRVMDGRLQQGCDFEYGIRVVLGKGILMELGAQERLLAAGSEEEREGWGAALMSCRQGALEVGGRPEASGQGTAGRNETGEGLGGRLAKWGVAIGKGVESVLSADVAQGEASEDLGSRDKLGDIAPTGSKLQTFFSPHDVVLEVGEMELGWTSPATALARPPTSSVPSQPTDKVSDPAPKEIKQAITPGFHDAAPVLPNQVTITAPPSPPPVRQGWLYSREPALLALWHKRWCVVRQGQLDLYEDDSMQKLVMTVPLSQCRIEKTRVMDGRLQQGCDFEYGIRVVLGKGILMELGAQERLLAAGSEEEREGWGAALMSCRQGVLFGSSSHAGGRNTDSSNQLQNARAEQGGEPVLDIGRRIAAVGVGLGKSVEKLISSDYTPIVSGI